MSGGHRVSGQPPSLINKLLYLKANVLVTIVLTCTSLYTAKNSSLTWPGLPPVTFSLASLQPLLDPDLKDEVARLTNFFESFSKLELPRSAANLLVLVAVFNSEFCVLEDAEAVAEARLKYVHLLYECLCQSVGIRKACTLASKLHALLQNLDRLCQILGQKFVNV